MAEIHRLPDEREALQEASRWMARFLADLRGAMAYVSNV